MEGMAITVGYNDRQGLYGFQMPGQKRDLQWPTGFLGCSCHLGTQRDNDLTSCKGLQKADTVSLDEEHKFRSAAIGNTSL
jgi:hypothetical protein